MNISTALQRYEQGFAEYLGVRRAFAFWKGRVALYAILKAMGIREGDEVILAGYTCVMAVNPVVYVGAKPIFIDIEPVTYNMDPNQIEAKITPRTKLIIAQHTYGYPAAMDAILDVASRKGLPVVEDCCLSLGSTYDGRVCGTFGAAAYFSFQWNKPYTTGLGGLAVTSDKDLAAKLESLQQESVTPRGGEVSMLRAQLAVYRALVYPRTTALAQNVFRWLAHAGLVVGSSSTQEFTRAMPDDFFKRMSAVQARSGLRQLRHWDRMLTHRRKMKRLYDELLRRIDWPVPEIPAVIDPVLVRYPVRVVDKERALANAARHFVELGSWFETPLHPHETNLESYGYHTGMCPGADRAAREVVNLPMHMRADERTARRSVEFIATIGPARTAG